MTPDQIFQLATLIIGGIIGYFSYRQREQLKRVQNESATRLKQVEAEAQSKIETVKAESQARIETVETNQIEAKGKVAQQEAQLEILRQSVSGHLEAQKQAGETQKQWQEVVNTMSQRRVDMEQQWLQAMRENTAALNRIADNEDAHAIKLANLDITIHEKLVSALATVETAARDNRTDLTTAISNSITERARTDSIVQNIFDTIARLEKRIVDMKDSKFDYEQTFKSIKAQLDLITDTIAPSPALLGVTPQGGTLSSKPSEPIKRKEQGEP